MKLQISPLYPTAAFTTMTIVCNLLCLDDINIKNERCYKCKLNKIKLLTANNRQSLRDQKLTHIHSGCFTKF